VRVIGSRAERASTSRPGALSDPELAWLLLWLICVAAIVVAPRWQVIPLDAMWLSLALLYGFRLRPNRQALALIGTAFVSTAAAIGVDALRDLHLDESVEQMPLLAMIFVAMAWKANRRTTVKDKTVTGAEAERLVAVQRQFLQDASHQLRTPITIALGHAELLAQELAGQQQRDIDVVVGELDRLKALSEQLLLTALSENAGWETRHSADLDVLVADLVSRWQPTAPRRWRLGKLDPVRAPVDAQRLGMALDALVENAVRHTGPADEIEVSVIKPDSAGFARIVVQDSGSGIAEADLPHIFDRFRTRASAGSPGSGLGLALVRAVARGHGGDVTVRSALGHGSRFELMLAASLMQDHKAPDPAVPGLSGSR